MTDADVRAAVARLRGRLAAQLNAAAQLVTSRDRLSLAHSFPPASKAGEHPHRRTGNLLASSDYAPKSLDEMARGQSVVFFRAASYDLYLLRRGRLGVNDTVAALRGQLAAMFGGGVSVP